MRERYAATSSSVAPDSGVGYPHATSISAASGRTMTRSVPAIQGRGDRHGSHVPYSTAPMIAAGRLPPHVGYGFEQSLPPTRQILRQMLPTHEYPPSQSASPPGHSCPCVLVPAKLHSVMKS